MPSNREIAETFAKQFDPPLNVVQTERVNNVPTPDAWSVAYWDNSRKIGITAVVYHGQIHAYLEAAGPGEIAEASGQTLANALGLTMGEPRWQDIVGADAEARRVAHAAVARLKGANDRATEIVSTFYGTIEPYATPDVMAEHAKKLHDAIVAFLLRQD